MTQSEANNNIHAITGPNSNDVESMAVLIRRNDAAVPDVTAVTRHVFFSLRAQPERVVVVYTATQSDRFITASVVSRIEPSAASSAFAKSPPRTPCFFRACVQTHRIFEARLRPAEHFFASSATSNHQLSFQP